MNVGLDAKLAVFDKHAAQAVAFLTDWLIDHPADLIALARGRHVRGHYEYEDTNFLEWTNGRLRAEAAEEVADAIVYLSRLLHREGRPRWDGALRRPPSTSRPKTAATRSSSKEKP